MRILNVNPFIDPVSGGGTAERTYQISRHQSLQGDDVTILTTDFGLKTSSIEGLEGVDVEVLRCLGKRFLIPYFSVFRLFRLIRGVDVVHLMGHWTLLNIIVFCFIKLLGKPYAVCPAGALIIYGRSRLLKRIYNLLIGKRIIRSAQRCIAITQDEIKQFVEYGAKEENISVIPNGIDSDVLTDVSRSKNSIPELPKRPFLLFMGRLNHIKGPDILLEAYKRTEGHAFDLVFVGPDDGMLDALQQHCEKEPSLEEHVHFLGPVYGADKYKIYEKCEALFIPSRKEAMSIVVLEAAITATPVVLSDQCGFDEVENIGGGKVVQASIDGVIKGLEFVSANREQLPVMGSRLKKYAVSHYSWRRMVALYRDVYKAIL